MYPRSCSALRCILTSKHLGVLQRHAVFRSRPGRAGSARLLSDGPRLDFDIERSVSEHQHREPDQPLNRAFAEVKPEPEVSGHGVLVSPKVSSIFHEAEHELPDPPTFVSIKSGVPHTKIPTQVPRYTPSLPSGQDSQKPDLGQHWNDLRADITRQIENIISRTYPRPALSDHAREYELDRRTNSLYPTGAPWVSAMGKIFQKRPAARYNRALRLRRNNQWKLLKVAQWIMELKLDNPEGTFSQVAWTELPIEEKRIRWPKIATHLLLLSPRDALDFLSISCSDPRPPFNMVAACFYHLDKYHYQNILSAAEKKAYIEILYKSLPPSALPRVGISLIQLKVVLCRMPGDKLWNYFKEIAFKEVDLPLDGFFLFMRRFLELNTPNRALCALEELISRSQQTGRDVLRNPRHLETAQRICSKSLSRLFAADTDLTRRSEHLDHVLQLGVTPNRDALNLMVAHSLRVGDKETAWNYFDQLFTSGYTSKDNTYVAMLRAAETDGDHEMFDIISSRAAEDPRAIQNPVLILVILNGLFQRLIATDDPETKRSAFKTMLGIYSLRYDNKPLLALGIPCSGLSEPKYEDAIPIPGHNLNLLLMAYIRCCNRADELWDIYCRFRELVLKGDHVVAPLAEQNYVYNALIRGLGRFQWMLDCCLTIVDDMLRPLPKRALMWNHDRGRPIKHAFPTIHTWTTLLHAFLWHYEFEAAVKIRELMTEHKAEYDIVTWNVVIKAMSRMQRPEEVAVILKAMEAKNLEPDTFTVKALGTLRDHGALREALERLEEEQDIRALEAMAPSPTELEEVDEGDGSTPQDTRQDGISSLWKID